MDGTEENAAQEETLITVENVSLLSDDKSEGKGRLVLTSLYALPCYLSPSTVIFPLIIQVINWRNYFVHDLTLLGL